MLHTKRIGRIALAFPIAIFSGVNLSAYAAQEAGLSDRNHWSFLDEPADDNEASAPVARLWRNIALSYGTTRRLYREPDPLGRVDPLDSETGSIPTTLVSCHTSNVGYNRLSLTRASSVLNCQFTLA